MCSFPRVEKKRVCAINGGHAEKPDEQHRTHVFLKTSPNNDGDRSGRGIVRGEKIPRNRLGKEEAKKD